MSKNTFWVVMVVVPFNRLKLHIDGNSITDFNLSKQDPTFFCPVFSSKDDAEKWSNGRYDVLELNQTNELINYH